MARRKGHPPKDDSSSRPILDGAKLLIITGHRARRDELVDTLSGLGARCFHAWSAAEAAGLASAQEFDLALVHDAITDIPATDLVARLDEHMLVPGSVIFTDDPALDAALAALRGGALDLIKLADDDTPDRLAEAIRRARAERAHGQRVERLRRLCKSLNGARQEVSRQVGSLCSDLAGAYRELSDQLGTINLACEFGSLIRQELDIESLLRTTLEFVLAKIGPTNAAIFLPGTTGDYTLGAYVNYDCPKDTTEVLLDHLAAVLPARFEREKAIVVLATADQLNARLGEHAHWIGESGLCVLTCRQDNECLAVLALFRERRSPFSEPSLHTLRVIGELFGKQLSRVIHVHHRHQPKDQWGTSGIDDIDLAA